jgi:hypothetical protein
MAEKMDYREYGQERNKNRIKNYRQYNGYILVPKNNCIS